MPPPSKSKRRTRHRRTLAEKPPCEPTEQGIKRNDVAPTDKTALLTALAAMTSLRGPSKGSTNADGNLAGSKVARLHLAVVEGGADAVEAHPRFMC